MNKGLIVILFFVGFFAGLALGLMWANTVGMRDLRSEVAGLREDVTILSLFSKIATTPEENTISCLVEILGQKRYEQVAGSFGQLTSEEQMSVLPCYAVK